MTQEKPTFAQASAEYLTTQEDDRQYKSILKKHLLPRFEDKRSITAEEIRATKRDMQMREKDPNVRQKKGTSRRVLELLRTITYFRPSLQDFDPAIWSSEILPKKDAHKQKWCYLSRGVLTGLVKTGNSLDVVKRINGLNCSFEEGIIFRKLPGGQKTERWLHEYFGRYCTETDETCSEHSHRHYRREIFSYHPEMLTKMPSTVREKWKEPEFRIPPQLQHLNWNKPSVHPPVPIINVEEEAFTQQQLDQAIEIEKHGVPSTEIKAAAPTLLEKWRTGLRRLAAACGLL